MWGLNSWPQDQESHAPPTKPARHPFIFDCRDPWNTKSRNYWNILFSSFIPASIKFKGFFLCTVIIYSLLDRVCIKIILFKVRQIVSSQYVRVLWISWHLKIISSYSCVKKKQPLSCACFISQLNADWSPKSSEIQSWACLSCSCQQK